jgi:hypothetical protein
LANAQSAINPPGDRHTLKLDKGTLTKYVDAVRGEFTTANIVIDGDSVGDILLPKVDIRRALLPQVLQWVPTTASARKKGVMLQPTPAPGDSGVVYVFTVARAPVEQPPVTPDTISKDYPIDSMPDKGWPEAMRATVAGKLKVHPGSTVELTTERPQVLRVRGTRAAIQDADQTVSALERTNRENAPVPQLQTRIDALNKTVDSLRVRVGELEKRPAKPS